MGSEINITALGVVSIVGEIVNLDGGSHVRINYKKPRKSKMSQEVIPWSDIILVSGEEGETGTVIYKSPSSAVYSGKGEISEISGNVARATINNVATCINVDNCNLVETTEKLDDESEAPAKPARKKPVRKKKRSA